MAYSITQYQQLNELKIAKNNLHINCYKYLIVHLYRVHLYSKYCSLKRVLNNSKDCILHDSLYLSTQIFFW